MHTISDFMILGNVLLVQGQASENITTAPPATTTQTATTTTTATTAATTTAATTTGATTTATTTDTPTTKPPTTEPPTTEPLTQAPTTTTPLPGPEVGKWFVEEKKVRCIMVDMAAQIEVTGDGKVGL